jgi:hypothetical protein
MVQFPPFTEPRMRNEADECMKIDRDTKPQGFRVCEVNHRKGVKYDLMPHAPENIRIVAPLQCDTSEAA